MSELYCLPEIVCVLFMMYVEYLYKWKSNKITGKTYLSTVLIKFKNKKNCSFLVV